MGRKPAVDGQFYPRKEADLRRTIEDLTPEDQDSTAALGVLSPHAGYAFSGPVAASTFARIVVPDTVVLLNPSHAYSSPALALWTEGAWETPLGLSELDEELTSKVARMPHVTPDERPHVNEHSAEVVLPFIQYHNPDARLVFICVTAAASLDALKEFGTALAEGLEATGRGDALVVASSDMSHESGTRALDVVRKNDPIAVRQMEELDSDGLYRTCRQAGITMCGVLPAVAMMESVVARGGTGGVVVAQATSADSPLGSGNYVVGYAGMIFS